MILNEAIEEAKRCKIQQMFFKVDFANAYDTVDWGFINAMMERFGFDQKWRRWIMECISTASASVLVNGGRGLRQGDPLSFFLFLIDVEGLSIMMSKASNLGLFEAALIGSKRVMISHL